MRDIILFTNQPIRFEDCRTEILNNINAMCYFVNPNNFDEYNNEQYVDLGSWEVETGKFEDLTDITLTHEQGNSYHNHIEVINFGYIQRGGWD